MQGPLNLSKTLVKIFISRHNESDPTRAKYCEGCGSHVKIRTALKRERSQAHQNAERVARAISKFAPRFNESDLTCTWPRERLAGAYGRFSQDIAHATKKGHGKCKKNLGFGHLLVEAYKVLRLSQKMSPRHLKCCTCHTELIISKIKDDNSFKRRPCSPHTVPATNNDLQNHLWLRPANAFATSRKCHAWRADEKCPMSHAMQNSVSDFKMSRSATPATRNGHSHRP